MIPTDPKDLRQYVTEVRGFLGTTLRVLDVQYFGVSIGNPEIEYKGELHYGTTQHNFTSEGLARLAYEWAYQCKVEEVKARKLSGDVREFYEDEPSPGIRRIAFRVDDTKWRKWCIRYHHTISSFEYIQ